MDYEKMMIIIIHIYYAENHHIIIISEQFSFASHKYNLKIVYIYIYIQVIQLFEIVIIFHNIVVVFLLYVY